MKINLKPVLKFLGKFAKGAVKSIPGGAILVDGIENATKKDVLTGAPKSHDQIVWLAELIGVVSIVGFLVYKNIIPQDILIQVIQAIIDSI